MNRTFHHRITLGGVCGIIVLLLCVLYAFWVKRPILGLVMILPLVLVAESLMRTQYTFSGDKLIIYRGRLSRSQTIPISQIASCRPMTSVFGLVRYLLITYGPAGSVVSVLPQNEQAFVEFLRKKKQEENED